jgi:hypothetical protein
MRNVAIKLFKNQSLYKNSKDFENIWVDELLNVLNLIHDNTPHLFVSILKRRWFLKGPHSFFQGKSEIDSP